MISVFSWNAERNEWKWAGPEWLEGKTWTGVGPPEVVWIDLEAATAEEERLVYEGYLPVHPLTIEDINRMRRLPGEAPHFPKAEEFGDYLFVVVNPLDSEVRQRFEREGKVPAEAHEMTSQLSAILTHRVLVTHHYRPLISIAELRSYLERHPSHAARGPDYLFHLVLDATVDLYAPVLDALDASLDRIEDEVFARANHGVLARLLELKRLIISLRKTLVYQREVLARLSRREFALIDDREAVYYRNVYDHLVRFTDLIESSREMVGDLLQTHLAAAANRLSEVMKVLTMISTAILPMALITGIYGMNFDVLPGKNWRLGFAFSLALMGLSGLASFIYFRWKKWI
jgi:magnesium transporter